MLYTRQYTAYRLAENKEGDPSIISKPKVDIGENPILSEAIPR